MQHGGMTRPPWQPPTAGPAPRSTSPSAPRPQSCSSSCSPSAWWPPSRRTPQRPHLIQPGQSPGTRRRLHLPQCPSRQRGSPAQQRQTSQAVGQLPSRAPHPASRHLASSGQRRKLRPLPHGATSSSCERNAAAAHNRLPGLLPGLLCCAMRAQLNATRLCWQLSTGQPCAGQPPWLPGAGGPRRHSLPQGLHLASWCALAPTLLLSLVHSDGCLPQAPGSCVTGMAVGACGYQPLLLFSSA